MSTVIQETRYVYGHPKVDARYQENINKLFSDLFARGNAGDIRQLMRLLEDLIYGKSIFNSLANLIGFIHECYRRTDVLPIPAFDDRKSLCEAMSDVFEENVKDDYSFNPIDDLPDRPLEKAASVILYSTLYGMDNKGKCNFVQEVGRAFGMISAIYRTNISGLGKFDNRFIVDLIEIFDNMTLLTDCTFEEYKGVVTVFERMISARKLLMEGKPNKLDIYEILLANDIIEFWKINRSGSDIYEAIGMFLEEAVSANIPASYAALWESCDYNEMVTMVSVYVEKMCDALRKAERRLTEKELLKVFDSAWNEYTKDWSAG